MLMQFTGNRCQVLIGTIFSAVTLLSTPAFCELGYISQAQWAAQEALRQHGQPAAMEFDEQTIEKYAAVQVKLEEIYYAFAERLQGATDQEAATALQQEKRDKMAKAVLKEGLNIDTYNAITNQILLDEQLRRKIKQQQIRMQEQSN